MIWSSISSTIGARGMVLLSRAVVRFLNVHNGRIEAFIVDGHSAGHRFIKLLGFTLETPEKMRNVMPNGKDAYLYSRVS